MVPTTTSLTGFSGETIWPLGQLRLLVTIGDAYHSTRAWMNFMIVRSLSPYNGIIGRPRIREIQAVTSTAHRMLKFPVDGGIVTNRSTILIPAECVTEVAIGGMLSAKERTELCSLLKKHLDIFAWKPSDMTGVPRLIAKHRLNIREGYSPIRQKKRGQASERAKAIQAEMAESDEEKTAFHTSQGVYCYTKMPFGLKNTGATYQRLVDKAFDSQVGRNIEVYIDNLVIKSHTEAEMLRDIDEMFRTFLSKSAKRSLPLFKTLKKCIKNSGFHWTPEAEQAFKQLKQHLSTPVGSTQAKGGTDCIHGHELNYTPMEKLVLSLVFAAKRLRRYFQAHPIAEPWTLFTDGSSCVDGSGAGLILTSPEGTEFTYALRFQFTTSNNEAEYEALIAGLRIAAQMGVRNVYVSVDSKLVANQVLGAHVAKEENMIKYLEKVKSLVSGFANFSISQVPRSKNKKADSLSKIASTSFAHLSKQVLVEILKEKSIQEKEVTTVIKEDGPTWMTPIIEYLKEGTLLDDKKEASKLRIKARQYELLEGILYRRSFLKPWLRTTEGPKNVKFLIVAMDYFTKWIEAKAVATITGNQVKKFVWDNIVCRFGLPEEIVSDNGKQFSDNPFKDWCDKLNIIQRFALVKHPQSNGLIERANRSLGEGIKARLGEGNKNWIKELPHVLWAHRTMIKSSHGNTPFSLTYGTKAVIPAEIGMPTYRITVVDAVYNDEELRLNLDLLEERRERAAICEAKTKLKMVKYYNARVRDVTFRPGDLVYCSNDASHVVGGGKLGPKWEGPYEVTETLGDEAYKLRSTDGTILPRTWNIANLKKC
ncbi:reverse transcriptase domain-containing protein [Tanacetum coccineum]|uniref:Reverse transcriptase domain-containing protein n=1 Tax=Tanacetum coccineum TaxID=301880 RepID=A0ABQ4Z5G2_9ASTR